MAGEKQVWSDERVGQIMGNLLRAGVILAAACVFTGGILYLVRYGSALQGYRVFRGEPTYLRHVTGILHGALTLDRRAIVQLGLLLLIATPVARVAFSVLSFAMQRDWVYVGVTLIVFVLLLCGLSGWHL